MKLPLVAIPPRTAVLPLGSLSTSTAAPLLRFVNGLTIPSDGDYGLAIVGEGEGRRRLIQVRIDSSLCTNSTDDPFRHCSPNIGSIRNRLHLASFPTPINGANKPQRGRRNLDDRPLSDT